MLHAGHYKSKEKLKLKRTFVQILLTIGLCVRWKPYLQMEDEYLGSIQNMGKYNALFLVINERH